MLSVMPQSAHLPLHVETPERPNDVQLNEVWAAPLLLSMWWADSLHGSWGTFKMLLRLS